MKPPDIRDGRNYGGYNLTAHFIKQHGREMGREGRRWSRDVVEAYLDNLFRQRERERQQRADKAAAIETAIAQAAARTKSASVIDIKCGEIAGRGGRRKAAA